MAVGDIILGSNQYGKSECRLVRVTRDGSRHEIEDLTVSSVLRGDFAACHTDGDNSHVVTTDTQKNTVFAFAKSHGVGSPEAFLHAIGRHFTDEFAWVTGGRWSAVQYAWDRIVVDEEPHDHAFVRNGRETRTAVVEIDGSSTEVLSGIKDCTVLKSSGSEFHGYPRDRFTTLPETNDRILATSLSASWRRQNPSPDTDFDASYAAIRDTLLSTFASVHSLALQQSIFAAGKAVLEAFPDVCEIRLSCPNKHHFVVDLEAFGLDNPNEVFYAADRPYGLIEASVVREGTTDLPHLWSHLVSAR